MASVKQIRAAIKTTLENNLPGITVHRTMPGGVESVAVVVRPAPEEFADFIVAMGRGTDTYRFDLLVLSSTSDMELGQDALDDYVTGAGAKSIRQVVFTNKTLGLANTDAHVAGVGGYGPYDVGAVQHIGAELRLVVSTPGTE